MRQDITSVRSTRSIDGIIANVDVLNDSFLIHDEGSSIAKALLFIEDAVVLYNCPFEIAEEWKSHAQLFGELAIGGNTVNTNTKNLSFVTFEFSDISLIRF